MPNKMPELVDPDGWFEVRALRSGLFAISESLGETDARWGPTVVHAYLVIGSERAALIDAGLGIGNLRRLVLGLTDRPIDVLLTHYHYDHIASAQAFERVAISEHEAGLLAAPLTAEMASFAATIPGRCTRPLPAGFSWATWRIPPVVATRQLRDGDLLDLGGGRQIQAIHTPGHTPGSMCYLVASDGVLFTGDTVFKGRMNAHLEFSSLTHYPTSLRTIARLARDLQLVLPAHGPTPIEPDFLLSVRDGLAQLEAGTVPLTPAGTWLEADFSSFGMTVPIGTARPA